MMSPVGTSRTSGDVRNSVAHGGKPGMARLASLVENGPIETLSGQTCCSVLRNSWSHRCGRVSPSGLRGGR
jgi:hypothetical protein